MNERIRKSRAKFIATTVICLVFFGIPLIVVVQMIGRRLGNANVSEPYQEEPFFQEELVLFELRDKVAPEKVTWEPEDPERRGIRWIHPKDSIWLDEEVRVRADGTREVRRVVPAKYITRFKLSLPYNILGSSFVWDFLCAIVLAVLTFIPPLVTYLDYDKQRFLDEGDS